MSDAVRHVAQPKLVLRILLLVGLFALQAEGLTVALRYYFDSDTLSGTAWSLLGGYRLHVLTFPVVFLGLLGLMLMPRLRDHVIDAQASMANHAWTRWLGCQLLAFGALVYLTYRLSVGFAPGEDYGRLVLFVLVILTTSILSLATLVSLAWWGRFIVRERWPIVFSAVLAPGLVSATIYLREVATFFGDLTRELSAHLLSTFYPDAIFKPDEQLLGTSAFQVILTEECSGYEGVALVTTLLGLYLWLFRSEFRFPRALAVIPLGIVLIWCLNVVRIVALIAIGTELSPEMAMMGFHSNAGWVAFIAVSLGVIAILHRSGLFSVHARADASREGTSISAPARAATSLLAPLAVVLAATLLTGAFSAGFDWWYPVKVLATAAALWWFWRDYSLKDYRLSWAPLLLGSAVFGLWLALVPSSPDQNAAMSAHLASVPGWVAAIWLMFRVLGSAITVPLAEELAFRGYLLCRLSGRAPSATGFLPFSWIAILTSSIVFGMFHQAWLAGTLAGLIYAVARYRSRNLGSAIMAHATTNALLSGYVLITGNWAYW